MKKTNEVHFGIQRKIVANMTTESWNNVPHVTYNYEPDVTEFMYEYKRLNENCDKNNKVTLNTLMLKIIVEGLKANPVMNSHIEFDKKLVRGHIQTFEDINISMPMILPNGEMMTINLHNFENKTLDEMVDYIADVYRRVENTDLNEVMMDVSMDNTINGLKEGKFKQTFYRIIGSKTGKHRVKTLNGKAKREYYKIPETDRLTKHDIEQGTITVSNIGSAYREQRGATCLLEIVPPQVCAIAVGAVQDRPVVIVNESGEKEIAIRQIMPLCIAFDHRALDFGEIVPFIKRLDEIFEEPEVIHSWKTGVIEELDIEEIKHEREEREIKFNESKEREKERREAEKAAEKAQREAEKALAKAKKEAAKAEKEALEAQRKVEKEKEEARKKAEKEALDAQRKAEKEALEAQKKADEAQRKAEKEALEAKKRAEKEEKEKAKKEADRIKKQTEKAKKEAEKAVKEIQKSKEREEKALKDIEKAKQEAIKAQEKAEKAMAKVEEAEAHAEKIVSENTADKSTEK